MWNGCRSHAHVPNLRTETSWIRNSSGREWKDSGVVWKGANHVQIYGMDVEMIDCYKIPSWTAYGWGAIHVYVIVATLWKQKHSTSASWKTLKQRQQRTIFPIENATSCLIFTSRILHSCGGKKNLAPCLNVPFQLICMTVYKGNHKRAFSCLNKFKWNVKYSWIFHDHAYPLIQFLLWLVSSKLCPLDLTSVPLFDAVPPGRDSGEPMLKGKTLLGSLLQGLIKNFPGANIDKAFPPRCCRVYIKEIYI